jgi:DNA-binding PadR family transcriptional regulator
MFDKHHFRPWSRDRMFHRGDFKYLILDLLKSKPRHGYEIIRELEDKFYGFYTPSPGSVYPTLQYLEEAGLVTSSVQDGKKVYTITEEGLKLLADQGRTVDDMHSQMKECWGSWSSDLHDQFHGVMGEIKDLGRLVGRKARGINKDKLRRIGEALKKATAEIETIIAED